MARPRTTVQIEARGSIHRIPEEVAELLAFNLRAHPDEYMTPREYATVADKFEDALVGRSDAPLQFSDDESLFLSKYVDIICSGPYRSPDLIALFWALRGTDPPTESGEAR